MRFRISSCVTQIIRQTAANAHPFEACGLLFGQDDAITAAQVTKNVAENPERQFEIDPPALFAALRAERAGGPKILGYWHSHPSGDASPSARDAEMAALDDKLWLIVGDGRMALWRPVEGTVLSYENPEYSTDPGGRILAQPKPSGASKYFQRVVAVTGDIRDLLPCDKCDEELVPLLAEAGYPAVAPYLDELLSWTFDINWPIAVPMIEFLFTLGEPIVAPVQRVLQGGDSADKWDCMNVMVRHIRLDLRDPLADDLRLLAERPSEFDREAGIDELARELLATWQAEEQGRDQVI